MMRTRAYFLKGSRLVILLVSVVWIVACAHALDLGPCITISKRSFDFKEVKEGATVEHAFRVLNKGDNALEIKKVKPT